MNHDCCRFCGSSGCKLTTSVFSKDVQAFIQWTTIVLVNTSSYPTSICDPCLKKVKSSANFLSMIIETQMKLGQSLGESKNLSNGASVSSDNSLINALERRKVITVKKVKISETVKQEKDPLSYDFQMKLESKPMDSIIKEEPMETDSNYFRNETNNEDEDDEESDDVYEDGSDASGDDDDWEETFKKSSSSSSKAKPPRASTSTTLPPKDIRFTCATCKASYSDFEESTTHIKAKACVKPMKCEKCLKVFTEKSKFRKHKHSAHQNFEPKKKLRFRCEKCSKAFVSQSELRVHMESHIKVVRNGFTLRCMICKSAFNSHLDLIEHMKVHKKKKTGEGSQVKQKVAETSQEQTV